MSGVARFKDLCLDADDHQALADWWSEVLGYQRDDDNGTRPRELPVPIVDPAGIGPTIWFNPVPEKKTVKNRMHIDVTGNTETLLRKGATVVRRKGGDIGWDVLADPEGNEFCCFAGRDQTSP